jgi:MOSC domain-containing protein YiiM
MTLPASNTMPSARLASVRAGRVAPLGPQGVPSGFVKLPRTDSVRVGLPGLDGDEQADLIAHGGPEKAVYGYASSHYPAWRADFPAIADHFCAGAMGENLTIDGLDEAALCVGDIHAIGSALLQVCQPRQPCFKLSLHHGNNRLPKAMVRSGRSGWYYRVIAEGVLGTGDAVTLRERPNPDFAFARLVEIVYHGGATQTELARMASMPGLASQWRDVARQMLES